MRPGGGRTAAAGRGVYPAPRVQPVLARVTLIGPEVTLLGRRVTLFAPRVTPQVTPPVTLRVDNRPMPHQLKGMS